MKKLYYIQFLFLLSIVSVAFGMQPLSPSLLSEKKDDIRKALGVLSPVGSEKAKEAHRVLVTVYGTSPFVPVYMSPDAAKKQLEEVNGAYQILEEHGLGLLTREEIENYLREESALSDSLSRSFNRRPSSVADSVTEPVASFETPITVSSNSPAALFTDRPQDARSSHSPLQQTQIKFNNKDQALEYLGFKKNEQPSCNEIQYRMGLMELDYAIGAITEENLILAQQAFEYLKSLQK